MEDKFVLFSNQHFITMGIGFASCILLIFLGFFTEKKAAFAKIIAIAVLGIKIAELIFRHYYYGETVAELLPLHLCPIAVSYTHLDVYKRQIWNSNFYSFFY